jgi:hypothetical protein
MTVGLYDHNQTIVIWSFHFHRAAADNIHRESQSFFAFWVTTLAFDLESPQQLTF